MIHCLVIYLNNVFLFISIPLISILDQSPTESVSIIYFNLDIFTLFLQSQYNNTNVESLSQEIEARPIFQTIWCSLSACEACMFDEGTFLPSPPSTSWCSHNYIDNLYGVDIIR